MGHSAGLRAGTRYAFSRKFRQRGQIRTSTYLKTYKVGDIVDIVANGAGPSLPFKDFHGKTAIIVGVTPRAVLCSLYKKVGNRYMEKRVNVRVEHIIHSKSRDEFLRRVKENVVKRKEAKEKGIHVNLKRVPALPRGERTVKAQDNKPETVVQVPYDTYI